MGAKPEGPRHNKEELVSQNNLIEQTIAQLPSNPFKHKFHIWLSGASQTLDEVYNTIATRC